MDGSKQKSCEKGEATAPTMPLESPRAGLTLLADLIETAACKSPAPTVKKMPPITCRKTIVPSRASQEPNCEQELNVVLEQLISYEDVSSASSPEYLRNLNATETQKKSPTVTWSLMGKNDVNQLMLDSESILLLEPTPTSNLLTCTNETYKDPELTVNLISELSAKTKSPELISKTTENNDLDPLVKTNSNCPEPNNILNQVPIPMKSSEPKTKLNSRSTKRKPKSSATDNIETTPKEKDIEEPRNLRSNSRKTSMKKINPQPSVQQECLSNVRQQKSKASLSLTQIQPVGLSAALQPRCHGCDSKGELRCVPGDTRNYCVERCFAKFKSAVIDSLHKNKGRQSHQTVRDRQSPNLFDLSSGQRKNAATMQLLEIADDTDVSATSGDEPVQPRIKGVVTKRTTKTCMASRRVTSMSDPFRGRPAPACLSPHHMFQTQAAPSHFPACFRDVRQRTMPAAPTEFPGSSQDVSRRTMPAAPTELPGSSQDVRRRTMQAAPPDFPACPRDVHRRTMPAAPNDFPTSSRDVRGRTTPASHPTDMPACSRDVYQRTNSAAPTLLPDGSHVRNHGSDVYQKTTPAAPTVLPDGFRDVCRRNTPPTSSGSQDDRQWTSPATPEQATFTDSQPHSRGVSKWTVSDVQNIVLRETGNADLAQAFRDSDIDGSAFRLLTKEDLMQTFDLNLGPALRLLQKIKKICMAASSDSNRIRRTFFQGIKW